MTPLALFFLCALMILFALLMYGLHVHYIQVRNLNAQLAIAHKNAARLFSALHQLNRYVEQMAHPYHLGGAVYREVTNALAEHRAL